MELWNAANEADALLAAYSFYPDSFMQGTKPDPSEMRLLTGLMHGMEGVLREHPDLYVPVKHPRNLEELKMKHRVSYGMSRARFKRALSDITMTARQLIARVENYKALQERQLEMSIDRDLDSRVKKFLLEDHPNW